MQKVTLQVAFAFEDNQASDLNHRPMDAERERQLVKLMVQAINAVLQHSEGEQDEPA